MERHEVAIVGAGPAGLAAALRLRELGIRDVVVLEREAEAGGVPRHCGHLGFGWQSHRRLWRGPAFAARLRQEAEGLDLRTGTTVVALEGEGLLRLQDRQGLSTLAARQVLVATGTRETPRAARLIGGTRPAGVMNTGALQQHVYLRGHRPFARPVIVGSEWVAFSAILTCHHLGIQPVALLEAAPRGSAPWPGGLVSRFLYGVPLLTRTRLLAIEGRGQVEAVVVERRGRERRIACDGVILSGRFVPEDALLRDTRPPDAPPRRLAGNVQGRLKTSGLCWREGRAAAEAIARDLGA